MSRGRLLATLVSGWRDAGEHSVPWHAGGFGAGVYLVRYASGTTSGSRRVVLLR